jgi:hypothetical protein
MEISPSALMANGLTFQTLASSFNAGSGLSFNGVKKPSFLSWRMNCDDPSNTSAVG